MNKEKFRYLTITSVISNSIRYIGGIVFLLFNQGLEGILYAFIASYLFIVIFDIITIFKIYKVDLKKPSISFNEILKECVPLYSNNIITYLQGTLERYLILFFSNPSMLGIYSVANFAKTPISLFSAPFQKISLIDFSKGKEKSELFSKSILVSRFVFFSSIPIGFLLASLSRPIIILVGGETYVDAIVPFMLLSLVFGYTTWYESIGNSLAISMGHGRKILYSNVLAIISGFLFAIYLIPEFEVIGAAIVRTIILSTSFLLLLYFIKGNNSLIDWRFMLKCSIASLIPGVLLFLIDYFFQIDFLIIILIPLFVFLYLILSRFITILSEQDLELILNSSPKLIVPIIQFLGRITIRKSNEKL